MRRTAALAILWALRLTACRDKTIVPAAGTPHADLRPRTEEVIGVVRLGRAQLDAALLLRVDDDTQIRLGGDEVFRLSQVAGATVRARGRWEQEEIFAVERFIVLSVHNEPALDGLLLKIGDRYGVEEIESGNFRPIYDLPASLIARVGSRIWLTPVDGPMTAYGVIDDHRTPMAPPSSLQQLTAADRTKSTKPPQKKSSQSENHSNPRAHRTSHVCRITE
jgi:hypothetical protein